MSFDEYADYMTQKFRLSTAIAIIKTKPENLTTEQYINTMKNKINIKMDDQLDISLCSDDFDMDNNTVLADDDLMNISETILRDYHFENDLFEAENIRYDISVNKCMEEWPQSPTPCIPENLTQTTYYESQPPNPNPVTQADINPIIEQAVDNEATYCNTIDIENNIPMNIVKGPINIDSQKTILYTVSGFTQNTHYSPSQTNIIIPKGHIYGNNNNSKDIKTNNNIPGNNTNVIKDIQSSQDVNNDIYFNDILNNKNNDVINYSEGTLTALASENRKSVTTLNESHNTNDQYLIIDNERRYNKDTIRSNEILDIINNLDSHKTSNNDINNLRNVTNDSRNMNDRDVDNDRISNKITSRHTQNVDLSSEITMENKTMNSKIEHSQDYRNTNMFSQNIDENCHENIKVSIDTKNSINFENNRVILFSNTRTILNQASNTELNYSHDIENNENIIDHNTINESIARATENSPIDIFSQTDDMFNETNDNDTMINENKSKTHERNDDKQIMSIVEETHEIIPFKILEEFNKIKSFLNRNVRKMSTDGYSTDSGYRSDSQGRSNKSALQLSGNWLNQSGHCLFDYVMSCHLVVNTRDITNEIAQVLGKLIDKLHEEEKYPSFLEAILEANNILLQQLFDGANSIENVLLNRDENIQRLVLLNKSVHIQKFCIEKITNILTDYHSKLTDPGSIFELSNIDQIENLYYIFHVLEILLKKYNKNKELFSQTSTQPSQDDGTFKKSMITDLWKRKWNPNYQDGGDAGNCEKPCILRVCCEVLNKIIVECLNSYSLISYTALKCFNLAQS